MIILYAEEFRKQFNKLPVGIQKLYLRQEAIFKLNWRDPKLHIKKLINHPYSFSFRVTRQYRVLFIFVERDTTLFGTIWHRRDVYRR